MLIYGLVCKGGVGSRGGFVVWQCAVAWFVDLVVRFADIAGTSFVIVGMVLTVVALDGLGSGVDSALDTWGGLGSGVGGKILASFVFVVLLGVCLAVDTGVYDCLSDCSYFGLLADGLGVLWSCIANSDGPEMCVLWSCNGCWSLDSAKLLLFDG